MWSDYIQKSLYIYICLLHLSLYLNSYAIKIILPFEFGDEAGIIFLDLSIIG